MLAWFCWLFGAGSIVAYFGTTVATAEQSYHRDWYAPIGIVLVSLPLFVVMNWLVPDLAYRARWWQVRTIGLMAAFGMLGVWLGASAEYAPRIKLRLLSEAVTTSAIPLSILAVAIFVTILCLVPWGSSPRVRFFLFDRQHASNAIARRALFAAGCHALMAAFLVSLALESSPESNDPLPFPRLLWQAGIAYLVGMLLSLWQCFPQRLSGLIPVAALLSALTLLIALIAPSAEWPILVLAFGLGLAHTAPRNDLLANVPPRQRPAGLALMMLAQIIGVLAAVGLMRAIPSTRMAGALIAIGLAAIAVYFYLREFIELLVEAILAVTYPIRGYGPGAKIVPTRGPLLVVANHSTWLDPLWVAKLMPVRVRPLMSSRFYDLPLISWLMRKVFHTIRVPDSRFRREAPEIQQAISALDRGEIVMIFPEGWLKRRADQSLRRFGQGIYQILREKPQTPVVVCWIEGGWGSYMSYFNGPPTKNKKMDFFRRIRIAISEPEVLSLAVLSDQMQTRRHLMQACLHARTYLGLPELELPPFDGEEEEEEKNGNSNS